MVNIRASDSALNTAPFKLEIGSELVPIAFARNPKARRYILRFQEGIARVTIPRGGTLKYAEEFAQKHRDWIHKQMRRGPVEWGDGTMVWFRGELVRLGVCEGEGTLRVSFGEQELTIARGDDLRLAVEARMRTLATRELPPRTWITAQQHGLQVSAVTVRNQRSRWGSCSRSKRISLNWRLIQTPEFVRDYIIVHELMHLKEMNHSPRFWAHVENAFPLWREAEKWLRRNSGLLR
ncbi:MAG TPA: SprT family zinc-dependent metalloprotease [Verrucomicrobiae bacterium]